MNRRAGVVFGLVGVAALAYAVAAAYTALPPRAPVLRPPATPVIPGQTSVVVLIGCTFRADQVGAYGGPRGATPFLDEMAAEGTRFAQTIAQAPWTKAGVTSIVTGHYAMALGVNHPGVGDDDQRVPDVAITLAERFRDAGYATIGGTANPNANALFGFGQGFDSYHEATGLWREAEIKVPGAQVADEVLARVPASGPFYAQVLLVDAHGPYTAGNAWLAWAPFSSARIARYRAQLSELDAAFQHLVDGFAAKGHTADNTVFVVIGDHGEGLLTPEHHGKAHGFYLYPTAVHVPWLMRGPGVARGHVVTGLSAQVDLTPTLTGLLGLAPPVDLPGRDRSALLAGAVGETGETRVFTDTWFRSASRAAVYSPERMCQHDFDPIASASREKKATKRNRIAPSFPTACFDLRADPDATDPQADPLLMQELIDWRADRERERAEFVAAHGVDRAPIDDATREALRGLGYVE